MRAHEFLTETVAKTHSHHEAAQRSFTRSRDPGGYYPTYHQYRTGLALAMANGTGEPIDVDHETIVGPFWSYHPYTDCLLYTSPSPRDGLLSRMPSSA